MGLVHEESIRNVTSSNARLSRTTSVMEPEDEERVHPARSPSLPVLDVSEPSTPTSHSPKNRRFRATGAAALSPFSPTFNQNKERGFHAPEDSSVKGRAQSLEPTRSPRNSNLLSVLPRALTAAFGSPFHRRMRTHPDTGEIVEKEATIMPGESLAAYDKRRSRRGSQVLLANALGGSASPTGTSDQPHSPGTSARSHVTLDQSTSLERMNSQTLLSLPDDDERFEDYLWDVGPNKKGTINPRSKLMRWWDQNIFVLLMYTATVTPFEVSFLGNGMGTLFYLNRYVDLAFIIDICLNFFLPIQRHDGVWVDSPRTIAIHYISRLFILDVISVLPYDIVGMLMPDNAHSLRFLRFLRLMRLAKLLRVVRAGKILARLESQMAIDYSHLRLSKFVIIVLMVSHWLACAWHMLQLLESNRELYDAENPDAGYLNWITHYQFLDPTDSSWVLYIGCLYWAVATLSTLGYGDIIPTTDVERAFTCLSALVGASIYAYMVGAVCGIVAGMNEKNTKFYQQIDNLNHFMKDKSLPMHLQGRLRDFFRFKRFNADGGTHQYLLTTMSPKLRGEVSIHMHSRWIKRMPIFEDSPREFYTEICLAIKTNVFSVRELVIREGEVNNFMHIIERGLVVCRGKFVTKGKAVGEDMLNAHRRRFYMAITLMNTVCYTLSRERLYAILESFPELKAKLRWTVVRKVFREAIMSYTRMVRATLTAAANEAREAERLMSFSPGSEISVSPPGASQQRLEAQNTVNRNDLALFGGDMSEQIVSHKLSILKREYPKRYETLESTVKTLQCNVRVRRAKKAFALRKAAYNSMTEDERRVYTLLNRLALERYHSVFSRERIDLTLLKRLSLVDLRVATEIPIGLCVTILDAAQTMRFEKLGDLYATPTGDSAVPSGTVLSSLMGGGQFEADRAATEAAKRKELEKKQREQAVSRDSSSASAAAGSALRPSVVVEEPEEPEAEAGGLAGGFGKFGKR